MKLNLGCGHKKKIGYLNVDNWGEPDLKHDLNSFPYPWDDDSIERIEMIHVLEHIPDWFGAFKECSRILKPGGTLQINVPDESSRTALGYRDHHHLFTLDSFHGTMGANSGTNAWAAAEEKSIPLDLDAYYQVPHMKYEWMARFGFRWLLRFCANHLRNFIHEQQFHFRKL